MEKPGGLVWMIFPIALTLLSAWLIVAGARGHSLQVGVIIALCLLGCLRQAVIFLTKGQKAYAFVTFAAVSIGIVAGVVSYFHLY